MKGVNSAHRRNPLPFNLLPRRCPRPAGFSEARFAPRSLQTLAAPFRGAKSSHNSRAAARGRPAFPRRGLLPVPREALWFRLGEQNLHTIPAPPLGAGRLFRGAVCSPFPANPCSSVPGSKFFTQFPRPRPGPAAFSRARFAPPSPRGLVLPSGGANSSHNSRATVGRRSGGPTRPSKKSPKRIPLRGFLSALSSFIYPFPPAWIPESGNSPLPGGLPCRKAGIPQSSSG